MISNSASIVTREISAEQAWKLMSDIDDWKAWDKSVEYSQLHGAFRAGSTFTLKPVGGPKVEIALVEVRPNEYFKDCTTFPLAKMYGEHWYEQTSEGLKLTVTMTMMGPLGFLWNLIVMKGIVSHFSEDFALQIATAKNR